MVGAKAAGHHGVPETNPSPDTSSKKLSSAARGSTVQFYVRQRKKKGRVRSRVKLVVNPKIDLFPIIRVVLLGAMRFAFRNMRCLAFPPDANWVVSAICGLTQCETSLRTILYFTKIPPPDRFLGCPRPPPPSAAISHRRARTVSRDLRHRPPPLWRRRSDGGSLDAAEAACWCW